MKKNQQNQKEKKTTEKETNDTTKKIKETIEELKKLGVLARRTVKQQNVKKIKTYIEGLDKMLYGGLVESSTVIIAGGPGCGKTLLLLQYVYYAAMNNEKALFISTNESIEKIKKHAEVIGLKENENVKFLFYSPYEIKEIIKEGGLSLIDYAKSNNIKKVALDSISSIKISFNTPQEENEFIYKFFETFQKMKVTSLITLEKGDDEGFSRWEFMADGIIRLKTFYELDFRIRSIEIVKMRDTFFYEHVAPYYITPHGVEIIAHARVFEPKKKS